MSLRNLIVMKYRSPMKLAAAASLQPAILSMGWQVKVVNPSDVPRSDKQQYQKTDKLDCRNLCKQLQQDQLRGIYVPTEQEATGKVQSGTVKVNSQIHALDNDGNVVETGRASKLLAFRGLERVPVDEARAGDIISIAGLTTATVSNTIADPSVTEPLHAQPIDPPTLSMRFAVNNSPMAGREGTKVTSRMIRDRLEPKAKATSRSASPKAPTRTALKWPGAANCSWAC